MKNEKFQHSEELAKYFSPRREEAPMLSAPEIEKLLAKRVMLPNPSHVNVRKIIMTLSAITGLGIAAYFAFFSNPSQRPNVTYRTDQSYATPSSHVARASNTSSQLALPTSANEKPSSQPFTKPAPRGPWSAGNDQIYADLTPEELARMGVVIEGDTIFSYKLNDKDSVERSEFSEFQISGVKYKGHSIGSDGTFQLAPAGISAPHFYPILMTFGNGNGAAYRIENGSKHEDGMILQDAAMQDFRTWLQKPSSPGLSALGYLTINRRNINGVVRDSITLVIGKNLPQPSLLPFMPPHFDGYSDSINQALTELAHYYEGKNSKPTFSFPSTLIINVDTATATELLDQMAQEENSATMQRLHSIMERLNELIPVIVRMKPGFGTPDSNDFIFWYEPSNELFAALPPAQAAAFRKKLAEPPQCMNAPEAVTTEAQVTYCVSEEQQVNVRVFDLMGHIVKSETQHAEAGDNIAKINTETLPSGMYIILVQDNDGGERTRRIWVQNSH